MFVAAVAHSVNGGSLFAAYVDSRPNWDDTGILVAGLLLTSGIISFAQPRRPWLHAVAIGGFMPLWSIARGAGIAPAVALIFTFIGAYAGSFTRHAIRYNAPT